MGCRKIQEGLRFPGGIGIPQPPALTSAWPRSRRPWHQPTPGDRCGRAGSGQPPSGRARRALGIPSIPSWKHGQVCPFPTPFPLPFPLPLTTPEEPPISSSTTSARAESSWAGAAGGGRARIHSRMAVGMEGTTGWRWPWSRLSLVGTSRDSPQFHREAATGCRDIPGYDYRKGRPRFTTSQEGMSWGTPCSWEVPLGWHSPEFPG